MPFSGETVLPPPPATLILTLTLTLTLTPRGQFSFGEIVRPDTSIYTVEQHWKVVILTNLILNAQSQILDNFWQLQAL